MTVEITRVLDPSDFELEVITRWTNIPIRRLIVIKSLQTKSLLPLGPIPSLGLIPWVPPAEESIRDIGIESFLFALLDIGPTMIIRVGRQDRSPKVILTVADRLHVLFGSLNHRRHMLIVLALSQGLPMNDDLMLGVHQGLAIVTLDIATSRLHLG